MNPALSNKIIIGGAIGNILEMYDLIIWGLLSSFLTAEFLPAGSNVFHLFSIYLITYIFRPVGGIFFGILSDLVGRKKVLSSSILVMGFCTFLVGILPSYQYMGFSSTIILILIRLVQVLTVGGEYISSVALLIENGQSKRSGYYGSWAAFGVNFGMMTASAVVSLIIYMISMEIIPVWSWRFAFVISILTSFVGFWIRHSLPESYEFIIHKTKSDNRNFLDTLSHSIATIKSKPLSIITMFLLVVFGITNTALIFVVSPLQSLKTDEISYLPYILNAISLFFVSLLIPMFGMISDTIGKKKLLFLGIIVLLIVVFPYFLFSNDNNLELAVLFHIIIAFPCAIIFAITPVFITEIFPVSERCSIAGFVYSIASCFGGGLVPLLATHLSQNHHKPYYLAFLVAILGYICLILLTLLNDRKKDIYCLYSP